MTKFIGGLIILLGSLVTIGLFAVLGGTIVYWIWPVVVPVVFPGLVTSGVIAAKLTWGVAVCLTWLTAILIKSNGSSK